MSSTNRYSNYDVIAYMYDEKGNRQYSIVEQFEKLLLQHLPEGVQFKWGRASIIISDLN
jgi:hypothetical protein